MKDIRKVLVVCCMHGNETFGLKVLARLQMLKNPGIVGLIAHPEAVAKRKRYIDTDLNRSFASSCTPSKETVIAESLAAQIQTLNPDLIIDIHTSSVDVGEVTIVARDTPFLSDVTQQLGVNKMVVMLPGISKLALNGRFPDKSIAVEFGKGLRSDMLAENVASRIANLLNSETANVESSLLKFQVQRILQNDEITDLTYTNYQYNPFLKVYPFLAGEKNYNSYAGFLATKVKAT